MGTPIRLAGLALLAGLFACSDSDPKALYESGSDQIVAGDYSGALQTYRQGLQALQEDTTSPEYLRLRHGVIEALCHTDPPAAVEALRDLADSTIGTRVNDYTRFGSELLSAGHLGEATLMFQDGSKYYPKSEALDQFAARLEAEALKDPTSEAASEALGALAGLGYLGVQK